MKGKLSLEKSTAIERNTKFCDNTSYPQERWHPFEFAKDTDWFRSSMKATVSWSCVSCLDTCSWPASIKVIPYDPGSSFTTLWSFFLPAKRRIHIHTLCKQCMEEKQCYLPDDQLNAVLKKRDQITYTKRLPWVKQQWDFWISCAEVERINGVWQRNGEVSLHLYNGASLG